MSNRTSGYVYDTRVTYEVSRARERVERLRLLADSLVIPGVDTASVEERLAAAKAMQQVVRRQTRRMDEDLQSISSQAAGVAANVESGFKSLELQRLEIERCMGTVLAQLDQQVDVLDQERRESRVASRRSLFAEREAEAAEVHREQEQRQSLLNALDSVIEGIDADDATRMGVDLGGIAELTRRAKISTGTAGVMLARQAVDEAMTLATEVTWRRAKLDALRRVHQDELKQMGERLEFTSEARAELVGEGERAMDRPVIAELRRLEAQVRAIDTYESADYRFEQLGRRIETLATEVTNLRSLVDGFETLDHARHDLVERQLQSKLECLLGTTLERVEVVLPDLMLKPVEVRYRTASRESVDCTVALDGTLSIHHYGHSDQRSCADAAERMARQLPAIISVTHAPTLDLFASEDHLGEGRTAGSLPELGRGAVSDGRT